MLYREIIAVCSQIQTKQLNTLCGQNVEFVSVKLVVHIVTTGLYRVIYRELYIYISSPYRAVNALHLGYKNQSMYAV